VPNASQVFELPLGTTDPNIAALRRHVRNSTAVGDATTSGMLLVSQGDAPPQWQATGAFPPTAHVFATTAGLGSQHTTTGLTAGQVVRATGATTAAFMRVSAPDVDPGAFPAGTYSMTTLDLQNLVIGADPGVGTEPFRQTGPMRVYTNAVYTPGPIEAPIMAIVDSAASGWSSNGVLALSLNGSAGQMTIGRSGGTLTSPTAVTTGMVCGALWGAGQYDTTVGHFSQQAGMRLAAAENWSLTARGMYATMVLTPPGSITTADYFRFNYNDFYPLASGISFGLVGSPWGPSFFAGQMALTATTDPALQFTSGSSDATTFIYAAIGTGTGKVRIQRNGLISALSLNVQSGLDINAGSSVFNVSNAGVVTIASTTTLTAGPLIVGTDPGGTQIARIGGSLLVGPQSGTVNGGSGATFGMAGRVDIEFYDSTGAVDAKRWSMSMDGQAGANTFTMFTRSDTGTAGQHIWTVTRSANTVSTLQLVQDGGIVTVGTDPGGSQIVRVGGAIGLKIDGSNGLIYSSTNTLIAQDTWTRVADPQGNTVLSLHHGASGTFFDSQSFTFRYGSTGITVAAFSQGAAGRGALLVGDSASHQIGLQNDEAATGEGWLVNSDADGTSQTMALYVGTVFNYDRGVALKYQPTTTGANTGILSIGQQSKNNANWTHEFTDIYARGVRVVRISNAATGLTGSLTVSNGETITAGGLQVTAGNIGIGGPPDVNTGLWFTSNPSGATYTIDTYGWSLTTGTPAAALAAQALFKSGVSSGAEIYVRGRTDATSWTLANARGILIDDYIKGASSTITTQVGLYITSQTQGATNYSIFTNAGRAVIGGTVGVLNSVNSLAVNFGGFSYIEVADTTGVSTIMGSETANSRGLIGTFSNHDLHIRANNLPTIYANANGDVGLGQSARAGLGSTQGVIDGGWTRFGGSGSVAGYDVLSFDPLVNKWRSRFLQTTVGTGVLNAAANSDGTFSVYAFSVTYNNATPTVPATPVVTPIYGGFIIDMTAIPPSGSSYVLDYEHDAGSYTSGAIVFTSRYLVFQFFSNNSSLPFGTTASTFQFKCKGRGKADGTQDSAYSAASAAAAALLTTEVNAFGLIVASQIACVNLAAISADLGVVAAGVLADFVAPASQTHGLFIKSTAFQTTIPSGWTTGILFAGTSGSGMTSGILFPGSTIGSALKSGIILGATNANPVPATMTGLYLDFTATSTNPLLWHSKLQLNADGSASFQGQVNITDSLLVYFQNFSILTHQVGLAHGMTALVPTDCYGAIGPSASTGGLELVGFSQSQNPPQPGLTIFGIAGNVSGTYTNLGAVNIIGQKKSGTGKAVMAAGDIEITIGGAQAVTIFGDSTTVIQRLKATTGSSTLASTTIGRVPVAIYVTSNQSTTSTTRAQLTSFSLPANALASVGDSLVILFNCNLNGVSHTGQMFVKIGSTDAAGIGTSFVKSGPNQLLVVITRVAAASEYAEATFIGTGGGNTVTTHTTMTETLTGALTVSFEGNVTTSGDTLTVTHILATVYNA
jgi:hypothetical protein